MQDQYPDRPNFVTHDIRPIHRLSLIAALGMACLSLAGLFFQFKIYPTAELRRSFVPNDVVNLLLGLLVLLGSMRLARHGRLIGLLLWPGALFYITYNYIACAAAAAFSLTFVFYTTLVVLTVYTIVRLLPSIDSAAVRQRLAGAVPDRLAGGVLILFSMLFLLRAAGQLAGSIAGRTDLAGTAFAVLISDLLTMPCWLAGGVLLWRRQAVGTIAAAGLLFQASMLFIGLLFFFILQPLLTASPFPGGDFAVVFAMALVCFVPFGLFVRGVLLSEARA